MLAQGKYGFKGTQKVCFYDFLFLFWNSCWPSKDALSARSTAAFLLGQTMEGKTALDLALSQGNVALVRALGRMGCDICDISHGQITEEKKVLDRILYGGLPHWFVRTVGTLAHSGSRSLEEDGIVLENPEDIRNYTQKEPCQILPSDENIWKSFHWFWAPAHGLWPQILHVIITY